MHNTHTHTHTQVQLLVSPKDIENYNKIRKNLEKLKQLVEEAELWVQRVPQPEESSGAGGGSGGRVRVKGFIHRGGGGGGSTSFIRTYR